MGIKSRQSLLPSELVIPPPPSVELLRGEMLVASICSVLLDSLSGLSRSLWTGEGESPVRPPKGRPSIKGGALILLSLVN